MDKIRINLYELLKSISDAQDLVSPVLSNHHQQVAYLSYRLSQAMDLPVNEQKDIFIAGLVHDIGALSKNERLDIIEEETLSVNNHAFLGAKLLMDFKPLQNPAGIIKYHHLPWNGGSGSRYGEEAVPVGSHVIHLADRVCAMIKKDYNILSQIPQIMDMIKTKSNSLFEPGMVEALSGLSKNEFIWLDLISGSPAKKVNTGLLDIVELELDDMIDLSIIFAQIIDFRSSFTAQHSAGVAKTAEKLAELVGFSPAECKMMLVAGYLHDLGKLAIDNKVLEKPAKLDEEEFNEIRSHTYFTYQLLNNIPSLKQISEWASYHHERLDGKGYPFHINGNNLSLGSRVMAVADVFTAITENRPYRKGMTDANAISVLNNMVEDGALDGKIVGILTDNFNVFTELRETAQQTAKEQNEEFLLN
jgi:putative nucleotidyltransferase with HDIG domain